MSNLVGNKLKVISLILIHPTLPEPRLVNTRNLSFIYGGGNGGEKQNCNFLQFIIFH